MKKALIIILGIIVTAALALGLTYMLLEAGPETSSQSQIFWLILTYFSVVTFLLVVGAVQVLAGHISFFILILAHFVWFAWPALLGLDENSRWGGAAHYDLPLHAVSKTAALMLMFLTVNVVTYWLTVRNSPHNEAVSHAREESTIEFLPLLTWIMAAFFVLGMLPYFIYGGSLAEIVSGVMASRSEIKPWSVGAHVVSESGPITVIGRSTLASFGALALWLWLQRKKFSLHRAYSTLLLMGATVGALVTFFDSGTRTWTLMILGAPLITVVLDRLRQKQQVKSIAIGLMLVVGAIMLTQIQLYYRLGGDLQGMETADFVSLEDSDFFTETAIAVDLVPGQFEYIQQFEPLLFIANPIPRFLWQNKPFSKTVRIFSMGRSGFDEYMVTGVSRMPSIVGQHYLSWGMIGVLIAGMVWGWAFGLFERLQRSSSASSLHAFFSALGLVWLFTCSRGVYPGFHYPVLIVGLMLFLLKPSSGAQEDKNSA